MTTVSRPRLYLAGPEVFLSDAIAAGAAKRQLCSALGFEGVFPLDAGLDLSGLSKHEQARGIAGANESLMRSCDGLIANLTPFRGVSMDAGTAFEVGFMRALGRPVLGYTNVGETYFARSAAYRSRGTRLLDADRNDIAIEDFDLSENLMIEAAVWASGGEVMRSEAPGREMEHLEAFEACLQRARTIFGLRD